jgi:uncharacterized protein YndB with AHSA1/START domain
MAKIELEAYYPYAIEHVWEALVQPAALEQWLMKNEGFAPVPGRKFLFKAKPVMGWKGTAYCEVLDVEKPRLLRWSQRGEEGAPEPFIITWTLRPEGQGTRLTLEHDGLHGMRGFLLKRFMGAGWKRMFDQRIPTVLRYAQRHGWAAFPQDRRLAPADCDTPTPMEGAER